ncbi:hypothetical protein [Dehalobacter sp. TeCB1]|uniref:hypothetical protein n=1 Tax=Dehalobacter sp. TeCB1 TaxID=1843715 RepID=UPI00083A1F88|nr:hypothetical protein [Dehalobacter sp. TeCB1]OCZ51339.1 hypothetical protein A7D23_13020 [Dehalobacter sp. TeCB1]
MKKTIAAHMKDILIKNELTDNIINFGDVQLLGECAARAELKQKHPLDRNHAVINALERSNLFKKVGYCRVHFKGNCLWRNFKLIK